MRRGGLRRRWGGRAADQPLSRASCSGFQRLLLLALAGGCWAGLTPGGNPGCVQPTADPFVAFAAPVLGEAMAFPEVLSLLLMGPGASAPLPPFLCSSDPPTLGHPTAKRVICHSWCFSRACGICFRASPGCRGDLGRNQDPRGRADRCAGAQTA